MTPWPTVSVLVAGSRGAPDTDHTAKSVRASEYPGELQVLTGSVAEIGSPAEIANAHAGEARGAFLLVLPPGCTLDPRCIRRLVARAQADELAAAVAPQWRGPDGTVLEVGSYLSSDEQIRLLFRGEKLPPWLGGRPHRADLSAIGSMLIPARAYFAAGGYNLELDGSAYQAADLALRLTQAGGSVEVEASAVAFAPAHLATPFTAGSELIGARERFRADWMDRLDALPFLEPHEAAVRSLVTHGPTRRILWVAARLPDRDQSGSEARHVEMIETLVAEGCDVVVMAEQGGHAQSAGAHLASMGVRWVAPPPRPRWNLTSVVTRRPWSNDLLAGVQWDAILVTDQRLASRVIPVARLLSPRSPVVLDLGSVRFPDAHDPAADPSLATVETEVSGTEQGDGVVAASERDQAFLRDAAPHRPITVYSAFGRGPGPGPDPVGRAQFIGDLLHRPNVQALEWWLDSVAGLVEARTGYAIPLRVVGRGAEAYRGVWDHPATADIVGWRTDLDAELSRARILVVPLTYATGTGGRMGTALTRGVPVVASAPAASVLPSQLAGGVRIGVDSAGLAEHIAQLMTDDGAWEAEHRRIKALDIPALRRSQCEGFLDWLLSVEPAVDASAEVS